MGVHKCIRYGQLACFVRHYDCWKVYKGFRATYMLPSRRRVFQGRPCVFQQDNAKPHTAAAITTTWLRSRRVRVPNWPACSPDLSPIENIWRIIKQKIHQRRPRTLQQLETYIRQEWDQIPKLQKLITSMPRRLQTVWKEEEMLHNGKQLIGAAPICVRAGMHFPYNNVTRWLTTIVCCIVVEMNYLVTTVSHKRHLCHLNHIVQQRLTNKKLFF